MGEDNCLEFLKTTKITDVWFLKLGYRPIRSLSQKNLFDIEIDVNLQ